MYVLPSYPTRYITRIRDFAARWRDSVIPALPESQLLDVKTVQTVRLVPGSGRVYPLHDLSRGVASIAVRATYRITDTMACQPGVSALERRTIVAA